MDTWTQKTFSKVKSKLHPSYLGGFDLKIQVIYLFSDKE